MASQFIQQKAVPQIELWLETCRKDHPSCAKGARHADIFSSDNMHMISDISSDGLVPARLLSFSILPASQEDDVVKVTPTDSLGANTNYVALSHRWGHGEHCKLSKANYDELVSKGVKVEDLPLTFRESVELCRGLGISFLWIDSLCIIQDDGEDWKSEARRMAVIYDNATLTIAATDGIDSTKGLHIPDAADAKFATLNTRAWVCQEDMISPRTLAFTSGTVLWDCREAWSQVNSPALKSRPAEVITPVPVHPKDIFCFFRDWRLPAIEKKKEKEIEIAKAETREAEPGTNHIGQPINNTSSQEASALAKQLEGIELAPSHVNPDGVLVIEGPMTDAEREARKGQSFIEISTQPDGTKAISVYYGDDIPSHAAHIANHHELLGDNPLYNLHPDDWDPKEPEPFGKFSQVVTNLLRPEEDYEPFLKVWWQFISLYTKKQITFPSDRFLAINGVVTVAQRWTHMRNTFGLWYHFLVNELVWHVESKETTKRPSKWIVPSWSWASTLEGRVGNYLYRRLPVRPRLMLKPEIGTPTGTSFDQSLPIEAWQKSKYRSITLKGDLRRGLVTRKQDEAGDSTYSVTLEIQTSLSAEDNEEMYFMPDCEEEWPVGENTAMLSLLMHHYDGLRTGKSESRDVCLVLRRAKLEGKNDETSILDVPVQEILTDDRNFVRVGYLEIVYPASTRKSWEQIWEDIWWREVILV